MNFNLENMLIIYMMDLIYDGYFKLHFCILDSAMQQGYLTQDVKQDLDRGALTKKRMIQEWKTSSNHFSLEEPQQSHTDMVSNEVKNQIQIPKYFIDYFACEFDWLVFAV